MFSFKKLSILASIGIALLWIFYFTLGESIASFFSNKWGDKILQIGRNKFPDAKTFVYFRFEDLLFLITTFFVMCFFLCSIWKILSKRREWIRCFGFSLAFCAAIDLFVRLASDTVVFWMALLVGAGVQNLAQFEMKRNLLEENIRKQQIVLLGSSQTRAQIDEDKLNTLLGDKYWTTELHYPGNRAFDALTTWNRIENAKPHTVICYLSESYFYTGVESEAMPVFFNFAAWKEWRKLSTESLLVSQKMKIGLLGSIVSTFRIRDAIQQRFLGHSISSLRQQTYENSLDADLAERSRQVAKSYTHSPQSDFQFRAIQLLVEKCHAAGTRLILIEGAVSPTLSKQFDHSLRIEMLNKIRQLTNISKSLVLLHENEIPQQGEDDYIDFTHVNEVAQLRLTEYIAKFIKNNI